MSEQNVVVYNEGELELKVSVDEDIIWLSQVQMSELFSTSIDNISLHLKNIYKERELDEKSTVEESSVVRKEGNRTVKRKIKHYNLDVNIFLIFDSLLFAILYFPYYYNDCLEGQGDITG